MANPLSLHLPLPKGQKLAVATDIELPSESSDSQMDSLPSADRGYTLGIRPLSSNRGGFRVREPLFLPGSSEDESGKHALYSAKLENDLCK
jgi:hypothetical protein